MQSLAARTRNHLTEAPAWQTFLAVTLPVLGIYLLTMDRATVEQGVDAIAAALPAWRFTQFGDIDMARFGELPWIIDVNGRILSNRPPGISWVAMPLYWVLGRQSFAGAVPSMLPGSATAALFSAGAVGLVHLTLRRITTPILALGGALVFGLGTSTWSISANELWAHGPAQFFLALGMLAISYNRVVAAGLAHGAALLIRPVTALVAAGTGLAYGWMQRSWRPVVLGGLSAAVGLAVLVTYNGLVLDSWSPVPASYGESFIERAQGQSPLAYVGDLLGMFLHPRYSIFVFSPFLLFTIPGLRKAWQGSPAWVRASAVGGVAYMLIHLRLNRFWGGAEFNYRYPLEMLTVLAPLLFLSWQAWYENAAPGWRRAFWYSVVASGTAQFVAIWIEFTNPTVV